MNAITVTRRIRASHTVLFNIFADPLLLADAIPGVFAIEFLSSVRAGVGLCFRRVRSTPSIRSSRVGDLEWADVEVSDVEVTACIPHRQLSFTNAVRGVIWDCTITLAPARDVTVLTVRSRARTSSLMTRLAMPVVSVFRRRAVEAEIDAIKAYCERPVVRRATNRLLGDVRPLAWPA